MAFGFTLNPEAPTLNPKGPRGNQSRVKRGRGMVCPKPFTVPGGFANPGAQP